MQSTPNDVYKCPKGTRDFIGVAQLKREYIIDMCVRVLTMYNTTPMDTPAFELTDVLTKHQNSDTTKKTFQLENDNNNCEKYTLRYDQTMPLARYCKEHAIRKLRRYQIGSVFRKDQPNMTNSRYRQFMQCDYDNVGEGQNICMSDCETLIALHNVLDTLNLTSTWIIRINTVQILSDMLLFCGIPPNLRDDVCKTLDKLDKVGWNAVKVVLKNIGLTSDNVDSLEKCITSSTQTDAPFISDTSKKYLYELFGYLSCTLTSDTVKRSFVIDISLARGLDYYTGIIFEANCSTSKEIGSIAAGGRYDGLCGTGTQCIGFSIGIDRISPFVNLITPENDNTLLTAWVIQLTPKDTSPEKILSMNSWKLEVITQLRKQNINCGTELKDNCGTGPQVRHAISTGIPFIIFIGEKETTNRTVSLKNTKTSTQQELTIENVISTIKKG